MTIEDLMRLLIGHLRQNNGSFITSTQLRNNPDVCHAACLWFLHNAKTMNMQELITRLGSTDMSRFKVAQEHATQGPHMPKQMLEQVRSSGQTVTSSDISAIESAIEHHRQPDTYISDVVTFVANVVVAMRTGQGDGMMIYMVDGRGPGHVICIRRNVGGIVIYDPNMGIMGARLADADTWAHVLRTILLWYRDHMGLTRFGYRFM